MAQYDPVTVQARVKWDHKERRFTMVVPGYGLESAAGQTTITFSVSTLYATYIRKIGEESWAPGFILPVTTIGIANLEPGQDYEMMAQELGDDLQPGEGAEVHITRFRAPDHERAGQA